MEYRRLGKTGFRVSEVGFGAWGIGGGYWVGAQDAESLAALHAAIDAGVNFIDTALAYGQGHSETLVGEVVRIVDGPLAPFGDAVELAHRVRTEPRHAGLFDLFLEVRNSAAAILDHTSLRDVVERNRKVLARRAREAKVRH